MSAESRGIKDNPIFEPLPEGWVVIGEMEKVCEVCGGTYYKRISYTNTNWVDTLRTKCACFGAKTPEEERRERLAEAYKMQKEIDKMFGPWDLLKDDAHDHMRIEKFQPTDETHFKALKIAKEFIPSVGNYCFYGRGGRGKTHIAVSMARKSRQMGYSTLAIKSIDLLNRLRKCYKAKDSQEEIEVMRLLKKMDCFMIDDLGIERANDWVKEKFAEVIDYRYNRKTTIFTTNTGGQEMEDKLGQGIVSRVWSRAYEMLGEDHRIKDWADVGREIRIS